MLFITGALNSLGRTKGGTLPQLESLTAQPFPKTLLGYNPISLFLMCITLFRKLIIRKETK